MRKNKRHSFGGTETHPQFVVLINEFDRRMNNTIMAIVWVTVFGAVPHGEHC